MLSQIVDYAGEFPDLRNNLMAILYRFLIENLKQIPRSQSLAPQEAKHEDAKQE